MNIVTPSKTRPQSFISRMGTLLMRMFGWRGVGHMPHDLKFILVAAPHTTGIDFLILIGMAIMSGLKVSWLGKHTLFRPPMGFFSRRIGGIPVDRGKSKNAVEQVVDIFNSREKLRLVIAPEGTRYNAAYWRTGFYYIALGAQLPVATVCIDWANKRLVFSSLMTLSGDMEADFGKIRAFYAEILGEGHPAVERIRLKPRGETD